MSTRKTTLKESTTTSQVDYVLVYERGSDELKKMNKTTFDAQYSSQGSGGHKEFIATMTQDGTNPIELNVLKNNTGVTFSCTRQSVGNHTLVASSPIFYGGSVEWYTSSGDSGLTVLSSAPIYTSTTTAIFVSKIGLSDADLGESILLRVTFYS